MLTLMKFQERAKDGTLSPWLRYANLCQIHDRRKRFNDAWHTENSRPGPFPVASAEARHRYFDGIMALGMARIDALISAYRAEDAVR